MAVEQAFFPISELSSFHTKWTICARVTSKAQMRTFRKGTGEGKVFHVELLDAEGGEIRASFFNDAVTMFHDKLQKGKCYTFSGGSVRVANRQFNQCSHRYELSFDKMGKVEEVADVAHIEKNVFKFADLRSVQTRAVPFTSDMCGILTAFQPKLAFTSKDGKELVKRDITIADDTATSINVTIWGERAQQEDSVFAGNPVVVLKGVAVKEWNNGRSGSLLAAGDLLFDANVPEVQRMKKWWSEGGSSKEIQALSVSGPGSRGRGDPVEDLGDMRRQTEQVLGDQGKLFTVVARLHSVMMRKQGEPTPLTYMACMETNRRVDSNSFCNSCNKVVKSAPRLMLRCKFADFADSPWLTTFHEGAQNIVGLSAEQVKEIEEKDGREAVEAALKKAYLQEPMQITVRAKLDMYNGEPRTNVTCVDARPLSRGERGRAMLREISQMLAVSA